MRWMKKLGMLIVLAVGLLSVQGCYTTFANSRAADNRDTDYEAEGRPENPQYAEEDSSYDDQYGYAEEDSDAYYESRSNLHRYEYHPRYVINNYYGNYYPAAYDDDPFYIGVSYYDPYYFDSYFGDPFYYNSGWSFSIGIGWGHPYWFRPYYGWNSWLYSSNWIYYPSFYSFGFYYPYSGFYFGSNFGHQHGHFGSSDFKRRDFGRRHIVTGRRSYTRTRTVSTKKTTLTNQRGHHPRRTKIVRRGNRGNTKIKGTNNRRKSHKIRRRIGNRRIITKQNNRRQIRQKNHNGRRQTIYARRISNARRHSYQANRRSAHSKVQRVYSNQRRIRKEHSHATIKSRGSNHRSSRNYRPAPKARHYSPPAGRSSGTHYRPAPRSGGHSSGSVHRSGNRSGGRSSHAGRPSRGRRR